MKTIATLIALSMLISGIVISVIVIFVLIFAKRYEITEEEEKSEEWEWINEQALVGPIPSEYDNFDVSNICNQCQGLSACKGTC